MLNMVPEHSKWQKNVHTVWQKKHPECPAGKKAAHLPVNDGLVLREAEDPGSGVSFLRFWGNTAYLNKTKAHLVKSIHSFPVLVKSCSDSYWISEFMAQDSHFLGRRKQSHRHTRLCWCFSKRGLRHTYVRITCLLNVRSQGPSLD